MKMLKIKLCLIVVLLVELLFSICQDGVAGETEIQTDASPAGEAREQQLVLRDRITGKIVFQSDRDGDWEIFVMNADGSGFMQLTDNSAYDGYPVWSPDGREIAFESKRDGNNEIYLMNEDGSNQRRLTHHPANDSSPAWSPDGAKIAFDSERESRREIYVMSKDGGQVEQLTKTAGKNALPAWSPDGSRLAYTGNRYLGWNIYSMTFDKRHDARLTEGHGACRPDWSPDGRKLAYVSHKSDKKGDIWLMNPDGSDAQQLSFDREHADYYPAWSPDGQFILYAKNEKRDKKDNWELYVIRSDGSPEMKLMEHASNDLFPDWAEGRIPKKQSFEQQFWYEAESLRRQIGVVRDDPDASQNKAVFDGYAESEGFIIYGPYQEYAPADYVATFRLKSNSIQWHEPIVQIEVVADRRRKLASQILSGQDFAAPSTYQEFSLPFSLKHARTLEFRVYSFAIPVIWVDWVSVKTRDAL